MTHVYLVMIDDRHTDPRADVFSTAGQPSPLYSATYSTEGDSVWVVDREIDRPDENYWDSDDEEG